MKRNRNGFYFGIGIGVFSLLVLSLMVLWAIPVSATHTDPVEGTLEASPGAVSPDDNIAIGSRRISITLTDPNLNTPQFVGTGPNNELFNIGSATGEALAVPVRAGHRHLHPRIGR